ncbi:1-(5-phosphoribosyl)-5-[(5-phosphoribosylamino)methylideneamino]imidazole-4-carboxamide isomerase [Phaeodactylibacter luteus]|uniref:1-(5-phosphoribosyl)-5-[(5-phosphoribosylamino)methylideneamino] imidazole-4-carboxamide isomerase n=1 Tax=Phaeodactylibacter luteus TaxID=1564516 RepID=A0A5C6RV00_9BACT|nr:1-(5-phosphoribosyl)-5-[(5-phosphoribosylamino)methylideneamino]imidazole-4-carboxamide isomerase [Phaeodactylibacter luteus]TXB66346.1 1-(5-phosphoribosyl)-5-[(5-phosphoribosylamino)methylideneamino]imidazole-4-carboxamide isomerase [Phaeodactylibacter luteus]
MFLIPAIDIIDGKCVRLTQGDYSQKKVYNEDPLEVAKAYEAHGLQRLHLVDLDGAKAERIVNHAVLEKMASKTSLHIDFGGGLKSDEDLRIAFECGAQQVTGGTIAVKDPETFKGWLAQHGASRIILGSDVKNGKVAVSGWQEESDLPLFPFLERYQEEGIRYTICTDVSKDGLLQGTSLELYGAIRDRFPALNLIASGGVTTMGDLEALRELGCYGAIIGKAIYEGRISLKELERF